ncbi:MAG: hypothetical protein FWC95_07815 [Defluviitaleaceae bacterium]|nr:hypothetical protein [Defluviitaleaceae bacterium]
MKKNSAKQPNVYENLRVVLDEFWSNFSVPAFMEGTVPRGLNTEKPYITYNIVYPSGLNEAGLSANIFGHAANLEDVYSVINLISDAISEQGELIPLSFGGNSGFVRIIRSNPFIEHVAARDNLRTIFRIRIGVTIYA